MIATALLMGFAGSLHCIGMCSPLAMTVSNMSPQVRLTRFIYNIGRICTYGVLGAIVGSTTWLVSLEKFQGMISISLGILLLVMAFTGMTSLKIPFLTIPLQKLRTFIINAFENIIQKKQLFSTFILGTLNGLLPCGLTFLALTSCLTLDGPIDGLMFMLLFGAGTLPAMLGITSVFQFLINRYRFNLKRITTITMAISGTLLIARIFLFHHATASDQTQHVIDIIICGAR